MKIVCDPSLKLSENDIAWLAPLVQEAKDLLLNIWNSFVFPEQLIFFDHNFIHDGANGVVPIDYNEITNEIRIIYDPCIAFNIRNHKLILYTIVHELAHYFDLYLRKSNNVKLKMTLHNMLWSEYFAHSTCCKVGLISVIEHDQIVIDYRKLNTEKSATLSFLKTESEMFQQGYFVSWRIAEHIERNNMIKYYTNEDPSYFGGFLSDLMQTGFGSRIENEYRAITSPSSTLELLLIDYEKIVRYYYSNNKKLFKAQQKRLKKG